MFQKNGVKSVTIKSKVNYKFRKLKCTIINLTANVNFEFIIEMIIHIQRCMFLGCDPLFKSLFVWLKYLGAFVWAYLFITIIIQIVEKMFLIVNYKETVKSIFAEKKSTRFPKLTSFGKRCFGKNVDKNFAVAS